MRILRILVIVCSALSAALPADAIVISNTPGETTNTSGAITFANFDSPDNASVASITGGHRCPSDCGGSNPTSPQTGYLWMQTSGVDNATIAFPSLQSYFGMRWGTPDTYNTITFFHDATAIAGGSFTSASPGVLGSGFTNFTASSAAENFNRIVLSSNGCCFEVDNFAALAPSAAVPEVSTLALLVSGLGLSVSYVRRRRLADAT